MNLHSHLVLAREFRGGLTEYVLAVLIYIYFSFCYVLVRIPQENLQESSP